MATRLDHIDRLGRRHPDPRDIRPFRKRVKVRVGGEIPDHTMAGVDEVHATRIAVASQEVERAGAGAGKVTGNSDQRDRAGREETIEG
jgi:hypothetical protein